MEISVSALALILLLVVTATVLFRPLIIGVLRAAVLVVRPRLSREEERGRAHMRDRQLVQRMIDNSSGPSHAAELRAMAARA